MERHKNKFSKHALGIISIVFLLISCNSSKVESSDTSIPDLILHYKQNGYDGKFSVKLFALIGATGGGSYYGSDFGFEIYQFDEKTKTKNVSAYEHSYSKGYFAIIVHRGDENKIKNILYDF